MNQGRVAPPGPSGRAAPRTGPPLGLLILLGLTLVLSLMAPNGALTTACWLVLGLVVLLCRRPGEPPVLAFAVGFQWVQVTLKVFQADWQGLPVNHLLFGAPIEDAIWLGLAGLLALAVGMRLALLGWRTVRSPETARREQAFLNVRQVSWAYLAALLLSQVAPVLGGIVPGLRQAVLALSNVRWLFFFLLAYTVFARWRLYPPLLLFAGIEIVLGFTGFFSGFKEVFFVLALAYLTARPTLSVRNLSPVLMGAVLAVLLGTFWMTFREDYRDFVSEGAGAQVVTVGMAERLDYLANTVIGGAELDWATGGEAFVNRLAYVDFFAYALRYVPRFREHEDGAIWGGAIQHIFMPRFFFPDKAGVGSDTHQAEEYTGLELTLTSRATSISLGYMAESYIDFGVPLMYLPVLLLGCLWGLMYRYFLSRPGSLLVGYGAAVAVLMQANQYEIRSIKVLGGIVTSFLVMALLVRFVLPRLRLWHPVPMAPPKPS